MTCLQAEKSKTTADSTFSKQGMKSKFQNETQPVVDKAQEKKDTF